MKNSESGQILNRPNYCPALVAASDWSVNPEKRWLVRAEWSCRQTYVLYPPEPLGNITTLPLRLRQSCPEGSIFLGVDFPVGWPIAFAEQTGFLTLRAAVPELGHGKWSTYFQRTDNPRLQQPFFPASSNKKGALRQQLALSLGLSQPQQLLRRCEQRTRHRPAAQSLFFTCGAQQVGGAANIGWEQLLQPHWEDLLLWPFDGSLEILLSQPKLTIAEVYPAEACHYLQLSIGQGTGRSKTRRPDRIQTCAELRSRIENLPIELSAATASWWETGFANDDQFDATVALIQMLIVLLRKIPTDCPTDVTVKNWEGWILGLHPECLVSASSGQ